MSEELQRKSIGRQVARHLFDRVSEDWARRSCAEKLVESGHVSVLKRLSKDHSDSMIDEALIRLGDCPAEKRLLEKLVKRDEVLPSRPIVMSDHWLGNVRCGGSMSIVAQVLKQALIDQADDSALTLLYKALGRTGRASALSIYDTLIKDASIPNGHFLWYQRDELLRELLAEYAASVTPDDWSLLAKEILSGEKRRLAGGASKNRDHEVS